MKKNNLLVLSLLSCTLLASCGDDDTFVTSGDKSIGTVTLGDTTYETYQDLQTYYESLKTSNGASMAVEKMIEKLAEKEYSEEVLTANNTYKVTAETTDFDVSKYHSMNSLKNEIEEKFNDIIDNHSYEDEDGNFDPEEYKDHIIDTYDYEEEDLPLLTEKASNYNYPESFKYNYDKYIDEELVPTIKENYIYFDYVAGSSKYKSQFASQYGIQLAVLKMPYDTTKENGSWNESFMKDVKAVLAGADETYEFGLDYGFTTFNSDNEMIKVTCSKEGISYTRYAADEDYEDKIPSLVTYNESVKKVTVASDVTTDAEKYENWTIDSDSKPGEMLYTYIEEILIAHDLYEIDKQVALAKNADFRNETYQAMTDTEKSEADEYVSTYTDSNAKSMADVVKEKKIDAQQNKYFTPAEYYTKNDYSDVIPSALTSLRGTSAKDLVPHLFEFGGKNFLLPKTSENPVYLDTSSNTYYVCEVVSYYGYYKVIDDEYNNSSKATKSLSNYQIEAYQNGRYITYKENEGKTSFEADQTVYYDATNIDDTFADIIELVEGASSNVISTTYKKEAIVSLFEKYSLRVHDQDVYDYVSEQYSDYDSYLDD